MKQESLNKLEDKIASIVFENIDPNDKLEILINLRHYLENYEENVKIIEEHRKKKLYKGDD